MVNTDPLRPGNVVMLCGDARRVWGKHWHDSRLDQIEQAFAVVGKRIWIEVGDLAGSTPANV